MHAVPRLDPSATLLFVINAAAGAVDIDARRAVIESALAAAGRKGEVLVCGPADLSQVATDAAAAAVAHGTAVIAVGGDGSLNTVAQAVHTAGCAMGVIPCGTFTRFGRRGHARAMFRGTCALARTLRICRTRCHGYSASRELVKPPNSGHRNQSGPGS